MHSTALRSICDHCSSIFTLQPRDSVSMRSPQCVSSVFQRFRTKTWTTTYFHRQLLLLHLSVLILMNRVSSLLSGGFGQTRACRSDGLSVYAYEQPSVTQSRFLTSSYRLCCLRRRCLHSGGPSSLLTSTTDRLPFTKAII